MLDDVCAVEVDIFNHCATILAVKNNVLFFSRWPAALDHDTNCIRRALGGMRHIRWDEKCFAFSDDVVHGAVAFADTHLDIAL